MFSATEAAWARHACVLRARWMRARDSLEWDWYHVHMPATHGTDFFQLSLLRYHRPCQRQQAVCRLCLHDRIEHASWMFLRLSETLSCKMQAQLKQSEGIQRIAMDQNGERIWKNLKEPQESQGFCSAQHCNEHCNYCSAPRPSHLMCCEMPNPSRWWMHLRGTKGLRLTWDLLCEVMWGYEL